MVITAQFPKICKHRFWGNHRHVMTMPSVLDSDSDTQHQSTTHIHENRPSSSVKTANPSLFPTTATSPYMSGSTDIGHQRLSLPYVLGLYWSLTPHPALSSAPSLKPPSQSLVLLFDKAPQHVLINWLK